MARLRYNGLYNVLGGAGLTNVATAITFAGPLVYNNNGTSVPTIVAPDYIPLSIVDIASGGLEIVYLTAYTTGGTTGTITRAQEGTGGFAHAAGVQITHDVNVADLGSLLSPVNTWTPAWTNTTTNPTGYTATGKYSLVGPLCFFQFNVTGASAFGSGSQYAISLPVAASQPASIFGWLTNSSNPFPYAGIIAAGGTSLAMKSWNTTAGAATQNVTTTVPFTFVAASVIVGSGCYLWV